jgi:hypothetical protein
VNRRLFPHAVILAGAVSTWPAALDAQQAGLAATPSLGDAMPLIAAADGVHLKFPVLLNAHTVVPPASTLRLVYIDPNAGLHLHDGGEGGAHMGGGGSLHHHLSDQPTAQGINPASVDSFPTTDEPPPGPTSKEVSTLAKSETWRDPQLFREALNGAADIGTMMVYTAPGKPRLLSAEIDLPGGMLLGGPDGKVVVLALTHDSEMRQAGLQPQDEIRAINGQAVPATLEAFAHFYAEITTQARKAGTSYTTQVWRPSQSSLVGFTVGAPPSIPSMF